jgi:hypothetical protein
MGPRSACRKRRRSDFDSILPPFTPEAMEKNEALIDLLKRIAAAKSGTRPVRYRIGAVEKRAFAGC